MQKKKKERERAREREKASKKKENETAQLQFYIYSWNYTYSWDNKAFMLEKETIKLKIKSSRLVTMQLIYFVVAPLPCDLVSYRKF